MANSRRGEAAVTFGGESYTLCLTLGALAELEHAFGADSLLAVGERLAAGRLTGRDLVALVAVGLRGGGHALSDAEVAALPLDDLDGLIEGLSRMLLAAFGEAPENPPRPQGA